MINKINKIMHDQIWMKIWIIILAYLSSILWKKCTLTVPSSELSFSLRDEWD